MTEKEIFKALQYVKANPDIMRQINADVLELFHCKECTLYPDKYFKENCDWSAIGHIREDKTVDAVPVVRCKDCIHRPIGDPDEHDVRPPKEDDYKCPCLCEGDDWYSWIPADDWFCGNGENKMTNEEMIELFKIVLIALVCPLMIPLIEKEKCYDHNH